MNKLVNKEQKFHNQLNKQKIKNWFRIFFLALTLTVGFIGLACLILVTCIASRPVDLTFFARYWLPLPIIAGITKDKPAGTLMLDQLVMKWPIQQKGFWAPISFEIKGLKIIDVHHQVKNHLDYGLITFDTFSLFHQKFVPLSVKVSGANFNLKRDKDREIRLDLPDQEPTNHSKLAFDLHHLYHIEVNNTALQLIDIENHRVLRLAELNVNLRPFYQDKTLIVMGHVLADFNINGRNVQLKAQSSISSKDISIKKRLQQAGYFQWHVHINQINPSHFADIIPVLPTLKDINIPVSADADIDFTFDNTLFMQPYRMNAVIKLGQGRVTFKNQIYYPSSGSAQIQANFTRGFKKPVIIKFPFISLQLRSPFALEKTTSGPSFYFAGSLNLSSLMHPQFVDINLNARSPLLDFTTLKSYWPSTVAKGAYNWVTENITKGKAEDFSIQARLKGRQGWHHLQLTQLSGGIKQAQGLEVHWLRPVPPLRQMNAQMFFVDPDRMLIKYDGGYQTVYSTSEKTSHFHKLAIPKGQMWITGLDHHQDLGIIDLNIQGKLQHLLTLLAEPRLKLLSRHPVPFKNPSGDLTAQLHVEVPLKKKVKIEQIKIKGHNEIKNVYLGDVALGQDLQKAFLTVDVNAHKINLLGKGLFSTFPASFTYQQNFYHHDTRSVMEIAKANLTVTPDTLKKAGFDMAKDLSGFSSLRLDYTKLYNKQAVIDLGLDLSKAGFSLPIWHKVIDQPAMVSARISLNNNKLIGVHNLHAEGNDLLIHADMNIDNTIPRQLNVQYFKTGRSVGKATLNFPMTKEAFKNPAKGDVRISVKANSLDIAPFIQSYMDNAKQKHLMASKPTNYKLPIAATGKYAGPRGRHWLINLQADKVYYNKDKTLGNVTAYMEYNGIRLTRLSYGMRKPTMVTASLFPKGMNRQFYLDTQDLGKLLEIIGMSTYIDGGHFILKGAFDDVNPEAPFVGKVEVKPFTLTHVPIALKRLSDLSIYGFFKKQKKDELDIDALKGQLSINQGILEIKDGRIYNAELGATLRGKINLDKALLDLQGTIVPVYAINKLFGHLPGVGKLFVPEKGGGFIAVPFVINGKFKDPKMDVHASKILTPGFLRQLF